MLSIAIDRFKARYRMPGSALREQPRMQRLVDDALARVLEGALEREGIGQSGHVCVRDVNAVARLRLREPDSALANACWRRDCDRDPEEVRGRLAIRRAVRLARARAR